MICRVNLAQTCSAEFSNCGSYRYRLSYCFNGSVLAPSSNPLTFLMLNPSTANEREPDPTVRRCIGYARALGHSGLLVANLFALRAPDPAALAAHADPVGPENDEVLRSLPDGPLVAAWGAHPMAKARAHQVRKLLGERPLLCLARTKDGAPRHPLYLRGSLQPVPWEIAS
jgi:hypothetical protein